MLLKLTFFGPEFRPEFKTEPFVELLVLSNCFSVIELLFGPEFQTKVQPDHFMISWAFLSASKDKGHDQLLFTKLCILTSESNVTKGEPEVRPETLFGPEVQPEVASKTFLQLLGFRTLMDINCSKS